MPVNPLTASARQAATIRETAHRPWPLPPGRWLLGQTWEDLLFAHWPVPPSALRGLVPPALEIETFDGSAWVGVLPFRLTGLRLRGLPPPLGLSSFAEINVRTYVRSGGKAGIFFFSLDAARAWAVAAARRLYKLPYYRARMSIVAACELQFASERVDATAEARVFRARYRGIGPVFEAERGSLEYFLAERYCAFTVEGRRIYRVEAHHRPWQLQLGVAEIEENTMVPAPVVLPSSEPVLHYAERQDALVWPPTDLA